MLLAKPIGRAEERILGAFVWIAWAIKLEREAEFLLQRHVEPDDFARMLPSAFANR
jgi:hypothetical protein